VIEIKCKYDELVDVNKLKDHPKNPNKHGQDQIEMLVKLFKYQGIRHPIIVSNLSGYIIVGHGRKLAAIRAGVEQYPVVYQDFVDAEQEYAFLISDNASDDWADLDLSMVNLELQNLGPDFDLQHLAIRNFGLIPNFVPKLPDPNEDSQRTCDDDEFVLRVLLDSDEQRQELFLELRDRGLKVKV
jgi:hypothetical protein